MNPSDFIVPSCKFSDIERLASDFWDIFRVNEGYPFPVMGVVEKLFSEKFKLFELRVEEDDDMGDYEAYTTLDGREIVLRESVYQGAYAGNGRDRFTVAHELGHRLLHTSSKTKLARSAKDGQKIRPHESSEAQANRFAAALLMPAHLIGIKDTPSDLAKRFGVSRSAACYRLKSLCSEGERRGPST